MSITLRVCCSKHKRQILDTTDVNAITSREAEIEVDTCPECLNEAREEGEQKAMDAAGEES